MTFLSERQLIMPLAGLGTSGKERQIWQENTYMQLVGCGVTIAPYVPDALARKLEDTSCQNPARRPQLRVIPGGVREVGLSLGPEHVCSERVQRATKAVADDLRGRWEVLLALLAVALCAALVISWALSGQVGAAGAGEVALEEHVVMDGDSLVGHLGGAPG